MPTAQATTHITFYYYYFHPVLRRRHRCLSFSLGGFIRSNRAAIALSVRCPALKRAAMHLNVIIRSDHHAA